MNWIIENGMEVLLLIGGAISGIWTYSTTRKNRALEIKIAAADAKLRELEVEDKNLDLSARVNAAVKEAVDSILSVKAAQINTLTESYEHQIITLRGSLEGVKSDLVEAEYLKVEASKLAEGYSNLIDRLRNYNHYLKNTLTANGITYREEDEI